MFEDTRPADLDASGASDALAAFRVTHPQERLALLRQLRDGQVAININGADGGVFTSTMWSLDPDQQRISFSVDPGIPALDRIVEADEAVAVAYMDSIKLQFDLQRVLLVHTAQACTLQSAMPAEIYRFQRRNAYRVRTLERHSPKARFRHPAIPDMALALRVLDLSIGGCALWMPANVPGLQAGTRLNDVSIELDHDTRFGATLNLQHLSRIGQGEGGIRLGCEWQSLSSGAERELQLWIDLMQKRRRLLALD